MISRLWTTDLSESKHSEMSVFTCVYGPWVCVSLSVCLWNEFLRLSCSLIVSLQVREQLAAPVRETLMDLMLFSLQQGCVCMCVCVHAHLISRLRSRFLNMWEDAAFHKHTNPRKQTNVSAKPFMDRSSVFHRWSRSNQVLDSTVFNTSQHCKVTFIMCVHKTCGLKAALPRVYLLLCL